MSEEAVAAVRALHAEFARGDFSIWENPVAEDFKLVTAPEMPDAGTYRGDAARRWLMTWVGSFGSMRFEPLEFLDGGRKVLVAFRQHGIPRGGQVPLKLPSWAVYELDENLSFVGVSLFTDGDAALKEAGLG